ncbi:MAG: dephospho-CoA kinase, partial [Myxococcota bacterium]|nr:dephospho-CoA kinase [Myxococcota bacterium]
RSAEQPPGELDRAAIARRVFADPEERRRLEAIVHPVVERELLRWIDAQAARGASPCFYAAPLLFEAGHDRLVDGVVVVACDEETRVRRVVERDGAAPADVRARIRAQMTDGERVARATHVLSNDATIDDLGRRVDSLLSALEVRQTAGAPA